MPTPASDTFILIDVCERTNNLEVEKWVATVCQRDLHAWLFNLLQWSSFVRSFESLPTLDRTFCNHLLVSEVLSFSLAFFLCPNSDVRYPYFFIWVGWSTQGAGLQHSLFIWEVNSLYTVLLLVSICLLDTKDESHPYEATDFSYWEKTLEMIRAYVYRFRP